MKQGKVIGIVITILLLGLVGCSCYPPSQPTETPMPPEELPAPIPEVKPPPPRYTPFFIPSLSSVSLPEGLEIVYLRLSYPEPGLCAYILGELKNVSTNPSPPVELDVELFDLKRKLFVSGSQWGWSIPNLAEIAPGQQVPFFIITWIVEPHKYEVWEDLSVEIAATPRTVSEGWTRVPGLQITNLDIEHGTASGAIVNQSDRPMAQVYGYVVGYDDTDKLVALWVLSARDLDPGYAVRFSNDIYGHYPLGKAVRFEMGLLGREMK